MDIIIRNGTIIDGSGKPSFTGDVGVSGDRISDIGDLRNASAGTVIKAEGKIIAPGFVDIMNHSDAYFTIFSVPSFESLLRQGVTTVLGGNCGASLAPLVRGNLIASFQKWGDAREFTVNWERFSELMSELRSKKLGVNFGSLAGHATIRRGLLGDDPRPFSKEELRRARKLLEDALEEGAFGLSFAPAYSHARKTPQEEIDELLEPVVSAGRLFSVHLRDEGPDIQLALKEALEFAERAGANLELSHLKVSGKRFWDFGESVLGAIDEAGKRGVNVHFDCYPYLTTTMVGYLLLPYWAAAGGKRQMLERLRNKEVRKKIVEEMRQSPWDYESMSVAIAHRDHSVAGKSLLDIAENQNVTNEEAALNLLIANEGRVIFFARTVSSGNMRKFLAHDRSFVASAGAGYSLEWAKRGEYVHPRSFGAFPRVLGRVVRGERLMTIERAIWKMTSGPAEKIGLASRGAIQKNAFADIVVFDPEKIIDRASFENPYHFSRGIDWVMVNGQVEVSPQGLTGVLAGTVLSAA